MTEADECLEALLDVRQDHELIDNRIRRLGRDDARLGDADIAPVPDALLRMADRRPLHRALHRARTATGAYRKAAQAEFVADLLGVIVFLARDRVPAPANDQVGPALVVEHARIAQDAEDRVRHAGRVAQVEARDNLVVRVHDVAQHGEQVFLDAADHLPVHKGAARRVVHLEFDAPGLAHDAQLEIPVSVEDKARIVDQRAGIQHRERTAPEQRIEAALSAIQQLVDFLL